MYSLATRALHILQPETAHTVTIQLLKAGLGPVSSLRTPQLAVDVPYDGGTLRFPNCVGLAAGFDKNAEVPLAMARAGFGFVECGTVTPLPQDGNPKPRLFRLTEDEAVINRMGFNNGGLEAYARNLEGTKDKAVIGLNIGANKDATDRMADYVTGLKRLWGMGSYFTINISSPNTPGLRALQGRSHLDDLLGRIAETRRALASATGQNMPIFLKIAPDLDDSEVEDTVSATLDHGLEGLIVSNTTLSREGLRSSFASEAGGMSGKPLFELSTRALKVAATAAAGKLVLIGAGGITSGAEAYAKIRAGASLVQLYSAMVYKGPGLADAVRRDLVARLKADGFATMSEAIGKG
ncbi:dihydroorotate dehydrogenase [Asticcacaulis sp. AC460]|uniref:quinone-dependent dihydroorotate dehydrogenase n=1 Tax=Asticcacaulis sp. AC460 TaxID=1282360 RepID=UPI0003C3FD53|nr:quinone-dependent dihydroorotate dehydrogenase [Asticcacaulis sp. AC460]ESQ88705.1 dihydroorotate dehydrogenase [Asticcacaulis sp. AC460]